MEFSRSSRAFDCKYFLKYDIQYISASSTSEISVNLGIKPDVLLENNLQMAPMSFVQNLSNYFDKDYLENEQKKKSIETKIELALKDNNFARARVLSEELEELIKLL